MSAVQHLCAFSDDGGKTAADRVCSVVLKFVYGPLLVPSLVES